MFTALTQAISQIDDSRLHRLVLMSVGLALAVLVGLGLLLWLGIVHWQLFSWGWVETLVEIGSGFAILVLLWLLFPAAVSATIGLFLEQVAEAVEDRHYPDLGRPRPQSIREALLSGAKFAAVAILLNLLALPVYILGIFFPPITAAAFYGLNGYLLGREYFETVALRRLDPGDARALRKRHAGRVFAAGVVITLMLTVPVFNLVAPVAATAFMLHLFESMRRSSGK